MARKPTFKFRVEAFRVALSGGLPLRQVAADFGVPCPAGDMPGKYAACGFWGVGPLDPARPAQPREANRPI